MIAEGMEFRKLVLQLLTEKLPLSDILDSVCEHASVQSIILNRDARLLAYSKRLFYINHMWTQIIDEGGIPYRFLIEHTDIIEELWRLTKIQQPLYSLINLDDDLQLVSVPMLIDNAFAGYVIICTDSSYGVNFLKDFTQLLGRLYVHKNTTADKMESVSGGFFMSAIAWELLASDNGIISDLVLYGPKQLGAIINGTRIPMIRPPFVIAALSVGNHEQNSLYKLGGLLRAQLPYMYFLVLEGTLLALFVNVTQEQSLYSTLYMCADRYGFQCGLSLPFNHIEERRCYKNQALYTLKLGINTYKTGTLFHADSFYPELLLKAGVDRFGSDMLWRSDLKALADYDHQNGTVYLKTLGQYLRAGCSKTKTASQLFIDRSTLNYRLLKIQSIMNCDLGDHECAHKLLMAICINDTVF